MQQPCKRLSIAQAPWPAAHQSLQISMMLLLLICPLLVIIRTFRLHNNHNKTKRLKFLRWQLPDQVWKQFRWTWPQAPSSHWTQQLTCRSLQGDSESAKTKKLEYYDQINQRCQPNNNRRNSQVEQQDFSLWYEFFLSGTAGGLSTVMAALGALKRGALTLLHADTIVDSLETKTRWHWWWWWWLERIKWGWWILELFVCLLQLQFHIKYWGKYAWA